MLEHVQEIPKEGGALLRVAPFCRNLMAYCRSHRYTSALCRSRIDLGGKGCGSKWVTTLAPIAVFNSLDFQGNQFSKEV